MSVRMMPGRISNTPMPCVASRCAQTAIQILRMLGADARLIETGGHPLVHARLPGNPAWPTVTVYNHLDVQPADGDDWRTDPFTLTVDGAPLTHF